MMYASTESCDVRSRATTSITTMGPLALCAATGFLSAFTVSIGGQMPVGELVLLAVLPWVMIRAYFLRRWPARLQQLGWFQLLLTLGAITAVGYVVSDLYRGTAENDLVRGWARVCFLALDLITVAFLVDRSWSRLRLFVIALCLGHVVEAVFSGPLFGEWWKFGVGYPITVVVLLLLAGRPSAVQTSGALTLALVNFCMGARSLGAICLLISALLVLHRLRGIWRPIVLFGALGAAIGLSVLANALILEDQNHAGSNVERESMLETSAELFLDSPLIGQGSWFISGRGLSHLEAHRAALDPSFRNYTPEQASRLAIHSQLLAALAEGGILGGAFFFGLGALVLKTIRTLLWNSVPARAFVFYLVLAGGWNLLMTPFSGVTRVEIALLVCACLLVVLQRQGELPEEYRE